MQAEVDELVRRVRRWVELKDLAEREVTDSDDVYYAEQSVEEALASYDKAAGA